MQRGKGKVFEQVDDCKRVQDVYVTGDEPDKFYIILTGQVHGKGEGEGGGPVRVRDTGLGRGCALTALPPSMGLPPRLGFACSRLRCGHTPQGSSTTTTYTPPFSLHPPT